MNDRNMKYKKFSLLNKSFSFFDAIFGLTEDFSALAKKLNISSGSSLAWSNPLRFQTREQL